MYKPKVYVSRLVLRKTFYISIN